MSCMENIVVYIPKGACVKNIPVQSLSSSTARKIRLILNDSEKQTPQTVTWICPVELQEKEAAVGKDSRQTLPLGQRPPVTTITPGCFLLPVVSSNITAFKVLRKVLQTQKAEIQLSGLETEAVSQPNVRDSVQRNALIVFNGQIFLSVRKSRCRRVRSAPSGVCPVSPSQHHQINTASSCQAQPLPDTSPRPQHSTPQDVQIPVRDLDINTQISPQISEEMPEQRSDCQKDDETTTESRSRSSPPKPPEGQETSSMEISVSQPNIIQTSSSVSEQPEAAGGETETHEDDSERLEAALLPRAESCLAFDFEQLAQEERINHLRARLRQKEAVLSNFNASSTNQI